MARSSSASELSATRSAQRELETAAAVFVALLATCLLDENAAHGLGGRGKEVPAAIPVLRLVRIHKAKIGLMHERRCLQRLPGIFPRQAQGCQFPQFVVDQRQQQLRGSRVASFDCAENLRDVGHGQQDTARIAL